MIAFMRETVCGKIKCLQQPLTGDYSLCFGAVIELTILIHWLMLLHSLGGNICACEYFIWF